GVAQGGYLQRGFLERLRLLRRMLRPERRKLLVPLGRVQLDVVLDCLVFRPDLLWQAQFLHELRAPEVSDPGAPGRRRAEGPEVEPDIVLFLHRPAPFDVDAGLDEIHLDVDPEVFPPRVGQRLDRDALDAVKDLDLGESFAIGIPGVGQELTCLLQVEGRVVFRVDTGDAIRDQLARNAGLRLHGAHHVPVHAERERLADVDVVEDRVLAAELRQVANGARRRALEHVREFRIGLEADDIRWLEPDHVQLDRKSVGEGKSVDSGGAGTFSWKMTE